MSTGFSDYTQPGQTTSLLSSNTARSTLMVAATGLGKTVMMSGLAETWPIGRVMMISHRFELNDQARKTFESFCGESVDFEQASFVADECALHNRCRIVVASVQSLNSKRAGKYRFEKFDPNDFGLIMIDEAHRAVSATYRRVIEHFQKNEDCCLVGVTATPDRLDGVGLGHVFETVSCDYNIRWGIDNGYLVPLQQKFVRINGLDLSSIRTKKNEVGESDLNGKELAELLDQESFLHEMAYPTMDIAGDESTIVFCASVSQAERIAEIINRHKPGSAMSLDGSLAPTDPKRKDMLAKFKNGDVQFFCNCGIATEGFDAPAAKFVVIARPTKSRALYTQMVGRVTRPLPGVVDGQLCVDDRVSAIAESGKPFATVLDFLGQAGKHQLVCTGDILAGENDPPEITEAAARIAQERDFDGDMIAALKRAKDEAEARELARRAKITARVDYSTEDVNIWSPMAWVPPRHVRGFEGNSPPSEKMKAALQRFGFSSNEVSSMNFKQAKAAMNKCVSRVEKGLCTIKQKRLLSKFGVDASGMTLKEASKEIDRIAKNGWKR